MLKRPKSAVLLSLPYNFQNKQQAVDIKQKVKKSLLTFQTEQSLDFQLYQNKKQNSLRLYIDNGPSLLNASTQHYSLIQPSVRTFRSYKSLQNSRATNISTPGHSKKNSSSNLLINTSQNTCTGLQNYQRLKPCKSISQKSIKNILSIKQNTQKQSKFIDRIFANLNPKTSTQQKSSYKLFKRNIKRQKQNVIQIKGKSVQLLSGNFNKIQSLFIQQTPYKTNIFQPTLQRKGLQLLRKSRAYLLNK